MKLEKRQVVAVARSVGSEFSRRVASHDVVSQDPLGTWNFEVVTQLDGKTGIARCQVNPPRKIQVLWLASSDDDEVPGTDPNGKVWKLFLDLTQDHPEIVRIEFVELDPLCENAVRLEYLRRSFIELRSK